MLHVYLFYLKIIPERTDIVCDINTVLILIFNIRGERNVLVLQKHVLLDRWWNCFLHHRIFLCLLLLLL